MRSGLPLAALRLEASSQNQDEESSLSSRERASLNFLGSAEVLSWGVT